MANEYVQKQMEKVNYLQIGSNIGNTNSDMLFSKDIINKNLILIEPVPYLFQKLVDNYKERHSNNYIILLNIAISNKDDMLELYVPSLNNNLANLPSWITELSSTNKDHIYNHTSQNFPNLIVDKISVPSLSLNSLIKIYKIKEIDYLIVDTEGHDYYILMDLDLNIIKPNKIRFENRHMDDTHTRGKKYIELVEHLCKYGYKLIEETNEDTTMSL
jgi:FkbM family methyltransferase